MNKFLLVFLMMCALAMMGCAKPADTTSADGDAGESSSETAAATEGASTEMAAISGGVVELTPENSSIRFVGTHTDPDRPEPRTGGFERFTGKAEVDPASGELKSVSVEIDTSSVWSQFDRLTTHLKSPDFFSVDDYPVAKFESTKIEAAGDGQHEVSGNLTLLDTTKEISFPATVSVGDSGLELSSEFQINRMEFGMNYGPDRVVDQVALMIDVGKPTEVLEQLEQGGGGGGRRGGLDPAAMFEENDADGDGKLSGDEIPERIRENVDRFDTDGDGAISLEEMQQRMSRGGGGRGGDRQGGGGRRGGGEGPDGDADRPQRPQRPDVEQ